MSNLSEQERGYLAAERLFYLFGKIPLFYNPSTPFEEGFNTHNKQAKRVGLQVKRLYNHNGYPYIGKG